MFRRGRICIFHYVLILPLEPIKDRGRIEPIRGVGDRTEPLLTQHRQALLCLHAGPVPPRSRSASRASLSAATSPLQTSAPPRQSDCTAPHKYFPSMRTAIARSPAAAHQTAAHPLCWQNRPLKGPVSPQRILALRRSLRLWPPAACVHPACGIAQGSLYRGK